MTGRGKVLSTEVDLMLKDNDGKSNVYKKLEQQMSELVFVVGCNAAGKSTLMYKRHPVM